MPQIETFADAQTLAAAVAQRAVRVLTRAQQDHDRAVVALTAGSIMEKVWSALASSASDGLAWDRVDVIWGDERFVPTGSPERNDAPAERLLFGSEPFSAARRFSMPASDQGQDLDAAAAAYAPVVDGLHIDLVLLGVGPDGHCCSLFPHHPALDATEPIVAVRNSPKPPPDRLSFSFGTLTGADEILVVASGAGKAEALGRAFTAADPVETPIAGARGRRATVWLLDQEAASALPD